MSEFDNKGAKLAVAPDGDKGDHKSGVMPRPPRPAPASGSRAPRPSTPEIPRPPRPRAMSAPGIEIGDPETFDATLLDTGERQLMTDQPEAVSAEAVSAEAVSVEAVSVEAPSAQVPSTETPSVDGLGPVPASLAWDDDDDDAKASVAKDAYVGTTLGERYVVDEVIGEGGMGRVYLAHHKVIGKKVAIKILHAELARDKEAVGRFVREAKAASSIGNPHIVDISDFGESSDGSTYFVMEYLDGITLGELIDKGAVAPDLVCDIGLQMCDGLSAAHQQQIIHRDLKPDNVTLVTRGSSKHFCKILDFGIAKVASSASSTKLTMAGAVFGTPHYMSPEQAAGAAVDHRTDIYSLGVILYEMAAGTLPFNADNFMGILTQHMYKAPVPIRALVGAPDCPPGLEAVILKSLSKKPEARYQTFDEFAADLRTLKSGGIPHAVHDMMARSGSFNVPADYFKPPPPIQATRERPTPRWGPRLVAIAGVTVAIAVVLFVLIKDSTTTAEPSLTGATAADTRADDLPAPEENEVLLGADPIDAIAHYNDEQIQLPSIVKIPEGKTITVQVYADGFEQQAIELDGSQKRIVVKLQALAAQPAESASATPTPPPRIYRPPTNKHPQPPPAGAKPKPGGDVIDPWAG